MHRRGALLLLGAAWALTARAAPPAPPPPPPAPPPGSPLGAAPPGACEKLGPCELFAQLQEHSRRIAGFSYNVKKADAALTALARQQAAAAARTERLAHALTQIEVGLEAITSAAVTGNASAVTGSEMGSEAGSEAGSAVTGRASSAAPTSPMGPALGPPMGPPMGPAPAGDWEQAAARELARLGDRLSRLREQVNNSFVPTIRENGEELASLRSRVAALNVQVTDLAAEVRGETVGRRVVAQEESPVSFVTVTPAITPFSVTRPTTAIPVTDQHPQEDAAQTSMATSAAKEVIVTTDSSSSVPVSNTGDGNNVNLPSVNGIQTTEENYTEATGEETPSSEDVQTGSTISTQNETDVAGRNGNVDNDNGNGSNGNGNGNGETIDSLGIELETVRTAFDTLHAQVTDLQARCNTRGEELEALVSSLEQRLAGLEEATRDLSRPPATQEPDAQLPATTTVSNVSIVSGEEDAEEFTTVTPQQPDGSQVVAESTAEVTVISNEPPTDAILEVQVTEVGDVIEDTTITTESSFVTPQSV